MNNNVSKRLATIFLVLIMFLAMLPGGIFLPITAQALGVTDVVTAVDCDGNSVPYTITQVLLAGNQTISDTGSPEIYLVEGTATGIIRVSAGVTTVLILNNVDLTGPMTGGASPMQIAPMQIESGANVTLVLVDSTTNTFTSNAINVQTGSGQAGIHVPPGATLTIRGQSGNSGELIALAGAYSAGIGGSANSACGDITIEGGKITAESRVLSPTGSGNGAGIGSGGGNSVNVDSNAGTITICGKANVTATSGGRGAGIGGGGNGSASASAGGTIKIFGMATVVAASSGNGAGIGGGGTGTGDPGACGTIDISGNPTVVATTASVTGNDIGPGVSTDNVLGMTGAITITGGNVYATKTTEVRNGAANGYDILEMTESTSAPNTEISQIVHAGDSTEYIYKATTNTIGKAYMWLPVSPSGNFANITITGVKNALGGQQLFQMIFRVEPQDMSPNYTLIQSVLPLLEPAWRLKGGEANKLANIDATVDQTIELIYETGVTDVTIYTKAYGTIADILIPITIPGCVIDAPYSYLSPYIPGYQLVDNMGADVVPYTTTIANVDSANNEITFFYKASSGNQVVIFRDADTHDVIGQTTISVPKDIATAIAIPSIANYTSPLTAQTVSWNDSTPLPLSPIVYDYMRAKATLTLEAHDMVTDTKIGTISYATTAQRVLEGYNYSSDITALTSLVNSAYPGVYALTPQGYTVYYISTTSANNVVKIYYNPGQSQSGTIPVECCFGSQAGPLIHSYGIPAAPGQTLTLGINQTPDFSGLGFAVDLAISDLSATEGVTGDKITLVYIDNRFETHIKNNLDGIVITDKTVHGQSIALHPPYKAGYVATQYSIDNGVNKLPIPIGGYSANAATDIIFYYEAYNLLPTTGNLTIIVTDASTRAPLVGAPVSVSVDGGAPALHYTDASGKVTFTAFGNYTIEVNHSGYQTVIGNTTLNAVISSQIMTIALAQINSSGVGTGGSSVVIIADTETPTSDGSRPSVSDAVQALFETDEHIRYIQGYPEGTVRPDSNITRAEVAAIFWRLLKNPEKEQAVTNSFHDVNGREWYAQAVNYLASIDIITGYDDGSFQPNRNITRAEFAAMISRVDDLEDNATQPFGDVSEDYWASSYIISAYLKGWINGYPGMVFLPENHITRAEVAKIVNYMIGRGIKIEDISSQFCNQYSDLPITHWAFAEVAEASIDHDYERLSDGYEIHICD